MAQIAFFGTPEFSLPALNAVQKFCEAHGHEISMVVTQPDREQGRGKKLLPPLVKSLALKLGLRVCQPEMLRKNTDSGDKFFKEFSQAHIDLAVVVAYGKLIPPRFLAAVTRNFVNIHGSLLPRFRGAAPVQRAIESGDYKTGVCLMDMVQKLDEGDVFKCQETPILASDTAATLFRRLSYLGAHLLEENLTGLLEGTLSKIPQSQEGVVYASMLDKKEGAWPFESPASLIAARARAFDPWPTLYASINNKRVQFFDSFFINTSVHAEKSSGTIIAVNPFLGIKAADGIVYFQTIQVEGKRALPIKEALLGFPLKIGDKIQMNVS